MEKILVAIVHLLPLVLGIFEDLKTDDTPFIGRGACISNPCLNDGLCSITPSGFLCTCIDGHIGVQCERRADECIADHNVHCGPHGQCQLDMNGAPRCVCRSGYEGVRCEVQADDCLTNHCRNIGTCSMDQGDGSYRCTCAEDSYGKQCQIRRDEVKQCRSTCTDLGNGGKCWHEGGSRVLVGWGYGDNICNSRHTCFNASRDNYDPKEYMEVQLKPVHMQINDELVFVTDVDAALYDYSFVPHILPMEAESARAFERCNTTHAVPVTSEGGRVVGETSKFSVNASMLRIGTQYFIADLNEIHRCILGLRLNVTVKTSDCVDPMDSEKRACNDQGRCYSDFSLERYECKCCEGFTGTFCEFEDPCYTKPCGEQGNCHVEQGDDGSLTHRCRCEEGFHGSTCNKRTDACEARPCRNDGWCIPEGTGYSCQCMLGFSGEHCENNLDECSTMPCRNGGTCHDGVNQFHCNCLEGYKGTICEMNIDDCSHSPCVMGTCLDMVNNYTCACTAGYTGRHCDDRIGGVDCDQSQCANNGRCIKLADGEFSCSCGIGYTGQSCELKIDLCTFSKFCIQRNSIDCHDNGANVTCECKPGWTGANCAINIDDCHDNACQNGGRCVDDVTSYTCKCVKGYTGENCQHAPARSEADIVINLMTDDCEKFKNFGATAGLRDNIATLVKSKCQCPFDSSYLNRSTVTCTDQSGMSAQFTAQLLQGDTNEAMCPLQRMIESSTIPTIYHNTYLVSVEAKCPTLDLPPPTLKQAPKSTYAVGLVLGSIFGVIVLAAIIFLLFVKIKSSRLKVGVTHKFQKETIAFDNAAYNSEPVTEENIYDEDREETSFTTTTADRYSVRWAHKYDRSRKMAAGQRKLPAGRLFDVHEDEKSTDI